MAYSNPNYSVAPLHPPVPPQCIGFGVHEVISCADKTGALDPVAMATADSIDSVAEKAQQDPQDPWSLTEVTTPFVSLQSSFFG